MTRHSKLQKQVLSLYKQFLQVTKQHPSFHDYVKDEFRRNATLPKIEVIKIEYLLRRGWRQLDMLKTSSVSSAGVFEREAVKDEHLKTSSVSSAGVFEREAVKDEHLKTSSVSSAGVFEREAVKDEYLKTSSVSSAGVFEKEAVKDEHSQKVVKSQAGNK